MASLKANFFIFHAIFEIFLFVLFSFCMRGILFVNGLPSIGNFQKISDQLFSKTVFFEQNPPYSFLLQ